MNILIIGGMHGNEPLGPKIVASLTNRPIPGVATLLANPPAIQANTRFIDQDLNRSFPGDPGGAPFETRRAAEIMSLSQGYDLIIDFHNTLAADNDCAFVGPKPSTTLLQAADYLGLNRVIIAEYDCINKYLPTCLSIEISITSPRMAVNQWRNTIAKLAKFQAFTKPPQVTLYRYVKTLTLEDRDKFNLQTARLQVFRPLPPKLARQFGQTNTTYPIFLGQNYTAGIYAGLITKISHS